MPPDCDTRDSAGRIQLRCIKSRNVFGKMLNSSSIHHTVNMKLLLIVSALCFAAALAAPADKQKRDILPGDPRYGTDQHHHHHHHEHENEVQISKAVGGYVGSFLVPDTEVHKDSFQVPKPSYGPPNHKPGQLIDYVAPDNIKDSAVQVPATSYGIPDTTQLNNNYLGPAIEEKKTSLLKVTIPKNQVRIGGSDLNTEYQAPSAEAPVTSYGVPEVKTISEQPRYDSLHVQKSSVGVPQAKVTKLPEIQGYQSFGSLPSFTSFNAGSSLSPSVYSSYPTSYPTSYSTNYPTNYVGSYQSFNSIPVKTVDHHVRVQVPQPYPVPVTKQVTYPVPVPHTVEVPKPYHVRVPYPVQVPVDRAYPVEVPRPVPYPVPHYYRTNVPVAQHQVVDSVRGNPFTDTLQTFLQNGQTTFQDAISNLPNFQNPLQGFQNPLQGFQNPLQGIFENFPTFPSIFSPSVVNPGQSAQAVTTPPVSTGSAVTSLQPANDAVAIENPSVKTVPASKTTVIGVNQAAKASTQKEYVQPTDANGGYIY